MGYGDAPQQERAITQQGGQYPDEQYADQGDYGYPYAGDMWAGRPPSDQAAQVRQAIFDCKIPDTEEGFQNWIVMVNSVVDAVARIPGIDHREVHKLNRKFKFLINRAKSQGSKKITEQRAQEFLFRLRSLVSQGDTELKGLTGIGSMISTHTNAKQEVRYPTQPQSMSGLLDMLPFRRR